MGAFDESEFKIIQTLSNIHNMQMIYMSFKIFFEPAMFSSSLDTPILM